ncbi:hypothetical protein NIES2130_25060 [Scytonema sp. HK-05]|nr:hypothetical protein NIES2130_25060 [Scytonema sp. HK-05]
MFPLGNRIALEATPLLPEDYRKVCRRAEKQGSRGALEQGRRNYIGNLRGCLKSLWTVYFVILSVTKWSEESLFLVNF